MRQRWLRKSRCRALALILLTSCLLVAIRLWFLETEELPKSRQPSSSVWDSQLPAECPSDDSKHEETNSGSVLDTAETYSKLHFLPQEGSKFFWNSSFEERYFKVRKTWKNLPLKVIVVPQSHADPGWLLTYEHYYNSYVSKILDNMVSFLNKTPDFKFIWSEMSFFSEWWNKTNAESRHTVLRLLKIGQLEITTGGWVMTDEATAHYWAMIDQLIEGHQWFKLTTGATPSYAWAIDNFGYSSTLPYILSSSGIHAMVILRVHYAWKAFLASTQRLNFYWLQNHSSKKIICHVAPSDLYSIKHTCGPSPDTCLQYDFRSVPGEFSESLASSITSENVRPKAERLLSQYGRFGSLFPHNVVLVPLGDDFRYNVANEWGQQYKNYMTLFKYINDNKGYNAHVRFGTLSDYFMEVSQRLHQIPITLPSIKGDFLPYADIYVNGMPSYWTGFYSSRPFFKSLARELEQWLRTAEIMYTFARNSKNTIEKIRLDKNYGYLVSARQNLALFQHHDAVTGTSRSEVMEDYGYRLHASIKEAMGIASLAAQTLIMPHKSKVKTWTSQIYPIFLRPDSKGLTRKITLSVPAKGRKIVIFNSLTMTRNDIIKINLKTPYINIFDGDENNIPFQINPVWNTSLYVINNEYEVIFPCQIKPLSFLTYNFLPVPKKGTKEILKTKVSICISNNLPIFHQPVFTFCNEKADEIKLTSPKITAKFTSMGLLKEIYLHKEKINYQIKINFYFYTPTSQQSGAYLFKPEQNIPIPIFNLTHYVPIVKYVHGKLISEVTYLQPSFLSLTTRIHHLKDFPAALELEASFDISKVSRDIELVMRLESDLNSKNIFYTDVNGFKISKRKYASKLRVQGNYYPATSAAYIEDEISRINLLMSHSHGVTSPQSGILEVMLDRRSRDDDNRGMSEGMMDNRMTVSKFIILPELITKRSYKTPTLTSTANWLSLWTLYPVAVFFADSADAKITYLQLSFLKYAWPSNAHLINLRTLSSPDEYTQPSNSSLIIIEKKHLLCMNDNLYQKQDLINFSDINIISSVRTSLTGTKTLAVEQFLEEEQLEAYKITFR